MAIDKTYFDMNVTPEMTGGSAVDFAKGLNTGEDAIFQNYLTKQQSQAKPLDIYENLETKAGLPQLRKTSESLSGEIANLEDALKGVKGNVADTSRNSLLTQGQSNRLVEARSAPLRENLATTATGLGRVQGSIDRAIQDIGTKVGLALQGQEMELQPYKQALDLKTSQNARLMTGFTTDKEQALNVLLDKIQAGRQLSIEEARMAQDLAIAEKNYQLKKDELISNEVADTQVIEVGGSKKLINSATGEIIANFGGGGGGGVNIDQYFDRSTQTAPSTLGTGVTPSRDKLWYASGLLPNK